MKDGTEITPQTPCMNSAELKYEHKKITKTLLTNILTSKYKWKQQPKAYQIAKFFSLCRYPSSETGRGHGNIEDIATRTRTWKHGQEMKTWTRTCRRRIKILGNFEVLRKNRIGNESPVDFS